MSALSPRYGELANGLYGSARAVAQFIILPVVLIMILSSLLEGTGNGSLHDLDLALTGLKLTFVIFGSILAILSFFTEFYPAGSISRLLFGQVRAATIIVLGYTLLISFGMHEAFRAVGPDVDLVSLFYLFALLIVLGMLYLVCEWIDYRWVWKKSKAAIDRTPYVPRRKHEPEDPKAHRVWHDFRFRYGRLTKGMRMAKGALLRYVILPIAIVIVWKALISSMGNTMTDQLSGTLGTTVALLFLVGIPIAVMSFFKGFYSKGSVSRLSFSLIIVALLDVWIWYATLQGRFKADLGMIQVDVDYQPYVLLLIFGVSLWALYYVVEFISYRKDWISQGFQPVDEGKAAERRLREKALRKAKKNKQRS
ncbi:MAG TPA: hypothetical protein VGK23_04635 [Methanomassiliicoccales archaeon]|jgi:hypothetical protein